jgi:hypothetical protein
MFTNKLALPLQNESFTVNNRLLGTLAIISAPMMLLFFMFGNMDGNAPKMWKDQLLSLTGILYIGGWLAGAVGMRRLRVTGDGRAAKIVFIIQITLLSFALLFSVMETCGYNYENGGLLFSVADAGYPLSHLFMIVVGVFVKRTKIWKGMQANAPFLVGLALPLFLVLSMVIGTKIGGFGFGCLTAIGLAIIGYTVYKRSRIYNLIFSLQS